MTSTFETAAADGQIRELTLNELDLVSGGAKQVAGVLNLGFFWISGAINEYGSVGVSVGVGEHAIDFHWNHP